MKLRLLLPLSNFALSGTEKAASSDAAFFCVRFTGAGVICDNQNCNDFSNKMVMVAELE
jgi:hypothetical protein